MSACRMSRVIRMARGGGGGGIMVSLCSIFECHDSVIRQRNMVCVFIYFVVGFGKS